MRERSPIQKVSKEAGHSSWILPKGPPRRDDETMLHVPIEITNSAPENITSNFADEKKRSELTPLDPFHVDQELVQSRGG